MRAQNEPIPHDCIGFGDASLCPRAAISAGCRLGTKFDSQVSMPDPPKYGMVQALVKMFSAR